MLSYLHPDAVWSRPGREYRGHDQIREMVRELRADTGAYTIHLDSVAEVSPDLVVARGRVRLEGTERETEATWHVHLDGGLVVRVETLLPG